MHFLPNALWSLRAGTSPLELSGPGRPGRVGGSPPHRPPPSAWLCEPHSQQPRLKSSACHKQEIPLEPLCVFIWAPLGAIWLLSPRWESAANYTTPGHTAALSPIPPTSPLPMPTPIPGGCSPQTSRILGNMEKERECARGMEFGWFRRAALEPPDLQVLSDLSQAPYLCPKSGLSGVCSVPGLG